MKTLTTESAQGHLAEILKDYPKGTGGAVIVWNEGLISFGSVQDIPDVVKALANATMCLMDILRKGGFEAVEGSEYFPQIKS